MKAKTLVVAAGLAACLASCATQPNAGCPVISDSLNTNGGYWGQFTVVDAGVGSCGQIPGSKECRSVTST